jgi:hypothetical protein
MIDVSGRLPRPTRSPYPLGAGDKAVDRFSIGAAAGADDGDVPAHVADLGDRPRQCDRQWATANVMNNTSLRMAVLGSVTPKFHP